jgi:hypothetical protein
VCKRCFEQISNAIEQMQLEQSAFLTETENKTIKLDELMTNIEIVDLCNETDFSPIKNAQRVHLYSKTGREIL